MMFIRVLFLCFVVLASARKPHSRKRACKPQQQPLHVTNSSPPKWSNTTSQDGSEAVGIQPVNGAETQHTSSPAASSPTPATGTLTGVGAKMSASFTEYGAGDSFGSGNCNTQATACDFYDSPGYNAALSQNMFGVGPGAGAGPACGNCYSLTLEADSAGRPASGHIVVKINNLCPIQGNILCSQQGVSGTNPVGANVHFDLCMDDGAAKAFFPSGVGMGTGHAVQVDCGSWSGTLAS